MNTSSPLEDLVNMVEGLELSASQYSVVSPLRTRLLNALVTLGLSTGGGGSSGLTLVENKIITAAAASVTFFGLDGDVDIKYRIVGNIVSTANPSNISLRPNGLATNLVRTGLRMNGGGTANLAGTDWILNGDPMQDGGQACFAIDFFAAKSIDSVALRRYMICHSVCLNASNLAETNLLSGQWLETATNLTSLVFTKDSGNISDGSNIILYKYT